MTTEATRAGEPKALEALSRERRQHNAKPRKQARQAPAAGTSGKVVPLHDGDVVRWMDAIAIVKVADGKNPTVLVRPVSPDRSLLGYSNRILSWDELKTPVHMLSPEDQVSVLMSSQQPMAS